MGGSVECILTGWGYTTQVRRGHPPNDLQMAVLPTLTNEDCTARGEVVNESEICTFSRYGQGACGVSDISDLLSLCLCDL